MLSVLGLCLSLCLCLCVCCGRLRSLVPVVPHRAVAEVSKIGNLQDRFVAVMHRCQSEPTVGPQGR